MILQLGYTSSSIWHRLLPLKSRIITNMDGLEWSRSKYAPPVRRFLKYAERLAVKSSHRLVADSEAIGEYLMLTYGAESVYIPYGADIPEIAGTERLRELGVEPGGYYLLIARMQPDNHVEEAIRGVLDSGTDMPLLVVGNTRNRFGQYLEKTYHDPRIRFTGGIFDQELLGVLRYHCALYFHGHSAGGTNPSLLEAMAASAPVCAHNNPFNRAVLGGDGVWFTGSEDIARLIDAMPSEDWWEEVKHRNLIKISEKYSWERVIDGYRPLLLEG